MAKVEQTKRLNSFLGEEEKELVSRVIGSQVLGYYEYGETYDFIGESEYVKRFEEDFSRHLGIKRTLAVNSGNSALEAALAACDIKPGDEVIVAPRSFISSSMCVLGFNAVPVFADVDPRNSCLTAEEIEKKVTKNTRAMILVHIFGQPVELDPIMKVAREHDLYVIEDCAEAYDAYYKGRKVGTVGDVAAFSLQQSKHITTGEGGLFATDNEEMYERAASYTNFGMRKGHEKAMPGGNYVTFGHNFRMGQLAAAVGYAQLKKIRKFNEKREMLVQAIEEELGDLNGLQLPYVYPDTKPNFWTYVMTMDEGVNLSTRDMMQICREREKVPLWAENTDWPATPSYLEPVFRKMNRSRVTPLGHPIPHYVRYEDGTCPKLEKVIPRSIAILVHHGIPIEIIRRQARAIRNVIERRGR
jgi:dTDP-4-amino-4,6-dideoxygalactose transaminase